MGFKKEILNMAGKPKLDLAAREIFNTLSKGEKPCILIVCPEYKMFEWHSGLMVRLGLEFKFFSADTINFVSKTTANLLIAADRFPLPDCEWDLLFLDTTESKNLPSSANTLIFSIGEPPEEVTQEEMPETQVNESDNFFEPPDEKVDESHETQTDENDNPFGLSLETPSDESEKANVSDELLETIDELSEALGELTDIPCVPSEGVTPQTFSYRVDCESLSYSDNEDRLTLLLTRLADVIDDPYGSSVVYFNEKQSMDEVHAAIKARFSYALVKKVSGMTVDGAALNNYLNGGFERVPKIILAFDNIASGFNFVPMITHIFNYDSTDNLCRLLSRFLRRGEDFDRTPTMYFFEPLSEEHQDITKEFSLYAQRVMQKQEGTGAEISGFNLTQSEFDNAIESDCISVVKTFFDWKNAGKESPISYKQFLIREGSV
ncbi:MAG: hypothetical protein FWH05_04045 [Oscillospiraceae bacterium]|nr:hypothetical protein [Oscillospiraceae bacterium]